MSNIEGKLVLLEDDGKPLNPSNGAHVNKGMQILMQSVLTHLRK